jgi:hypothetical protein
MELFSVSIIFSPTDHIFSFSDCLDSVGSRRLVLGGQ